MEEEIGSWLAPRHFRCGKDVSPEAVRKPHDAQRLRDPRRAAARGNAGGDAEPIQHGQEPLRQPQAPLELRDQPLPVARLEIAGQRTLEIPPNVLGDRWKAPTKEVPPHMVEVEHDANARELRYEHPCTDDLAVDEDPVAIENHEIGAGPFHHIPLPRRLRFA